MTNLNHILMDVAGERARQHHLHGDQSHLPDGTGYGQARTEVSWWRDKCATATRDGSLTYRHIFQEEVAEVLAETDPLFLRAELVQVAAVCVQWIQAIDARNTMKETTP